MADSLFHADNGTFVPTESAGNPWGELTGGGPVAGLLARSLEQVVTEPGMFIARMTVDLLRPVPRTPLTVATRVVRAGKRLQVIEATLMAGGKEVTRVTAQAVRRDEVAEPVPRTGVPFAGPHGIDDGTLLPAGLGLLPGVHDIVQTRWVTDQFSETPDSQVWMRMPLPLLPGEPLSPLAHVAVLADCISAASPLGPILGPWINTDITIYLHREMEGEWLGMRISRATQHTGVGLAEATLYDEQGPIGTASEAVIVNQLG